MNLHLYKSMISHMVSMPMHCNYINCKDEKFGTECNKKYSTKNMNIF